MNPPSRVLDALGVAAARVTVLKAVPSENASWLVEERQLSRTGTPPP